MSKNKKDNWKSARILRSSSAIATFNSALSPFNKRSAHPIQIGDYVTLGCLTLLKGKDPFDLPQFIVVGYYKKGVLIITDRADRQFIIQEKDVKMLAYHV